MNLIPQCGIEVPFSDAVELTGALLSDRRRPRLHSLQPSSSSVTVAGEDARGPTRARSLTRRRH